MTTSGRDGSLRTGVDVQAISRFREQSGPLAHGVRDRVFTEDEREYCESTGHPAQHYAARWAAKEAFAKIVQANYSFPFHDVEISKDGPRPFYSLAEKPVEHLCRACNVDDFDDVSLSLSLSHDRDADVALAQAVVSVERDHTARGELNA